MRIEELVKTMINSFFVITTGAVVSMYIFCLIFNTDASFSLGDIGRILLMALVGDLLYLVFLSHKEIGRKQMLIRKAIHLLLLLAMLLYLTRLWDWVELKNTKEVAVFIVLVLGVYVIVTAVAAYQDKRLADKLNKGLKERYHL